MSEAEWERSGAREHEVEALRPVLKRYRRYWPLSQRQLYYRMVKEGEAGTWLDEFAAFQSTLRRALVEGLLPLVAVSQGSDELREGGAWEDSAEFAHSEVESFLWGYRRDLMQGQERYLEVWVQKPSLMDLIGDVAVEYCVTTVCCDRLPMVRSMQDLRSRLEQARERTQSPVILFFGDYAPGAATFLDRVQDLLRTDGNLWEMEFRQEAVTADDVVKYDLPESVATRSRKSHGGAEPGSVPVELEALPPDVLAERVRSSIEACLDMALVNNQRAIQAREALRIGKLRAAIMRQMKTILRELLPHGDT